MLTYQNNGPYNLTAYNISTSNVTLTKTTTVQKIAGKLGMNYIINSTLLQTAIASLPLTGVITMSCYLNGSYEPLPYVMTAYTQSLFTPLDIVIIILAPTGIVLLAILDFVFIFTMRTSKKQATSSQKAEELGLEPATSVSLI